MDNKRTKLSVPTKKRLRSPFPFIAKKSPKALWFVSPTRVNIPMHGLPISATLDVCIMPELLPLTLHTAKAANQ